MPQEHFLVEEHFDPERMRHYLNGEPSVFHSYHYAVVCSHLADGSRHLGGPRALREASEETFYTILKRYYGEHSVTDVGVRANVAQGYYAAMGMGQLRFVSVNGTGGRAILAHSHVDEGWRNMWGTREEPVAFITQGYIAAAYAAIHATELGSYETIETQSIVSGADQTIIEVRLKSAPQG